MTQLEVQFEAWANRQIAKNLRYVDSIMNAWGFTRKELFDPSACFQRVPR